MEQVKVTRVVNPISNRSIVEYVPYKPLIKVNDFLKEDDKDVVVAVNGNVISKEEYDCILPLEAEIIIVPIIEGGGGGGGGKDVVRAIASIAVLVAAIAAPYVIPGLVQGTLTASLVSAGIAIGGSMLVNALFPVPKSDMPELEDMGMSEQTYGWQGIQSAVKQGNPIPVLYGKRRVGGNVIALSTILNGQKQYLNMEVAVAGHQVASISDVQINGQPSTNYHDITLSTRLGTNDQTPIPFMNKNETAHASGSALKYNVPVEVETTGDAIEGLKVNFMFPQGIFYSNDVGGLDARTVEIKIEYAKWNGSSWDSYVAWKTASYSAAQASALRYSEEKEGLAAGKYKIRLTRLTADNTNSRQRDEVKLESFSEIIYDSYAYPCTALVGIQALATDQLSGNLPNITSLVDRGNFASTDIGVHTDLHGKPSSNPAWAVYDILTNTSYGGDYVIDLSSFTAWADFCTTNGYKCNTYFDGSLSVWDAALRIAREAKGILKIEGTKVGVQIDQADTPFQLFNVANIIEDTFKEHFLPLEGRANCAEVTFWNEEHDYQREQFMVYLSDWNTETEIKKSITLYTITKYDEAAKHAQYMLNYNKYLTRTGEFDADIDAISCTVGDVIKFQHDVPQWGEGGRIKSATTTQVVLDKELTFEDTKEYKIVWRLQDDRQVEKTWTQSGTVTTDTIPLTIDIGDVPSKYDIYAVGLSSFPYKLVRIVSIDKQDDLRRHISWIEYNPSIYTDIPSFPALPTPSYDLSAHDLTVEQGTHASPSGDKDVFKLFWRGSGDVLRWKVYYKYFGDLGFGLEEFGETNFGSPDITDRWHYYGDTHSNSMDVIFDNAYYEKYTFAVCGVALYGEESPDEASQVSIITSSSLQKPFFPDGAAITSTFDTKLHIWWTKAICSAISHYEVSYTENGTNKTVSVETNELIINQPSQRDYSFSIVAVDKWGQSSEPLTGSANNAVPSTPSAPTLTPHFSTIAVKWNLVSDNDIIGYNVYAGKTSADTKVAFIQGDSYVLKCESGDTYYVAISAVDPFGEGNKSPETSTTALSAQLKDYNLDLPLTSGIEWSVSGSTAYWTEGELVYKNVVYSVSAGNTVDKYIWWDKNDSPTTFHHSNDRPAIGADVWLMAFYDSVNEKIYPATQNKIQHAGLLQASTITADLIGANEIITNVANIKDAIIQNAKIISLHGEKIIAGTLVFTALATDVTEKMFTSDVKDFSELGGTTKPEDNATKGATWGIDIANQPDHLYQTFYQTDAPTSGMDTGDYWIDTDDNTLHRYNGSSWVEIQDTDIQQALTDAATAQTTADSKIKTYFQATAPTGMTADDEGDIWFDTDDNNKPYRYNGSSWVEAPQDYADWTKIYGAGKPEDNADVTAENTADDTSKVAGTPSSDVLSRLFTDSTTRQNIENWRKAGSPTYIDGNSIYAQSIIGDKIAAGTITADKYNQLRNTYIYNNSDSLDPDHPFITPFKIVSEMIAIQSVKLSFKIEPYRAYSTGAAAGGGQTSSSGGGQTTSAGGGQTTSAGGGQTSSQNAGTTHHHEVPVVASSSGSQLYYSDGKFYSGYSQFNITVSTNEGHSHVITIYQGTSGQRVYYSNNDNTFSVNNGGTVYTNTVNNHRHALTLKNPAGGNAVYVYPNVNDFRTEGGTYTGTIISGESPDSHTHTVSDHTHTVSDHTHTVANHTHTVSDHTHPITYGIHEESNSPAVKYSIDNGSGYGTESGDYTTNQTDLNITGDISGAGWKAIKFTTNARCRIYCIIEAKIDINA